jgi:hypothetical protein
MVDNTTTSELISATPAADVRTVIVNRISWGAVLAGVAAGLAIQLVLNILGASLLAALLDPLGNETPSAGNLSIGAALWWAVSGILAGAIGGYVAGRTSGTPDESTASWHGFTSWAATTLILAALLTSSAGAAFSGVYGGVKDLLGTTVQTAATAGAAAVAGPGDPLAALEKQVRTASGGNDPAALRDAATNAVRAVVTGDQAGVAAAREQAAQAVATAQNISIEDARTQVAEYERQYRDAAAQAKQKALEAAETARKTTVRAGLVIVLALIFGALAAWYAGAAGAVEPTFTRALFRRSVLR